MCEVRFENDNLVVTCENEHIFHVDCINQFKNEEKKECTLCNCSMILEDDAEMGSLQVDKTPNRRRLRGLSPKKRQSVTFS